MALTTTTQTVGVEAVSLARSKASPRALLLAGLVAGPLYVLVGSAEELTRTGFDPLRDDLSVMANGPLGWIQVALFMTTGALTVAGAAGIRRALAGSRAGTWGPLLLGLYGLGLICAGMFIADPARGFPPGTPADAHAVSWHGLMHMVSGGVAFLGLIAGCFVFARRFASRGEKAWAAYSVTTGVLFLAAFVGVATGSQAGGWPLVLVTVAFTIAVVLGWTWISMLMGKLIREVL